MGDTAEIGTALWTIAASVGGTPVLALMARPRMRSQRPRVRLPTKAVQQRRPAAEHPATEVGDLHERTELTERMAAHRDPAPRPERT